MAGKAPIAGGATAHGLAGRLAAVDRYQQRHAWMGFPLAVFKKFGEDNGGSLAGLIAYYGFLSLFPLLLVFVTILGFALQGHPGLQQRVLHSTLAEFPVIGSQLQHNVHSLRGRGAGLVVGLITATWGGLGVGNMCQQAMNQAWDVPLHRRPNKVKTVVRSAALICLIGLGFAVTSALSGVATSSPHSWVIVAAPLVGSALVNVGVFALAFKLSLATPVRFRDVLPGAVIAGVIWEVFQVGGAYYISHQLRGSTELYGLFAVVLGLLSWLYLQAQVTMLCAEVNVVRTTGLWPRTWFGDQLGDADRRALRLLASVQQRRADEVIAVDFVEPAPVRRSPVPAGRPDRQAG